MRTSWPAGTSVDQIAADLGYEVEHERRPWQAFLAEPLAFAERVEVPETPPREWLTKPDWLEPGQKLTVLASGQAAGYWFQHGTCLVHDHTACPKPSAPPGYPMFAQNGEYHGIPVGVIGNVHGHASPNATIQQAQAHYSDPDAAMLIGACGDDDHGAWFAGCLIPDKEWTGKDVAFLNRCALSGDWRPLPYDSPWWEQNGVSRAAVMAAEGYTSLGPTLVTRPALPLVRSYQIAASATNAVGTELHRAHMGTRYADDDNRPVLLGGLGGIQLEEDETVQNQPCDCEQETRVATTDTTNEQPAEARKPDDPAPAATDQIEQLKERLEDLEQRWTAEKQAQLKAKIDDLEPAPLPPPDGFEERTMHLTAADVDHLVRTAAPKPKPSPKSAPDRPQAQRDTDAKSGVAMSDGSFPIRNCGDLANARAAIGRANPSKRAAVQAHISRRAKMLGCSTK